MAGRYELYLQASPQPDCPGERCVPGLQYRAFNAPDRAAVDALRARLLPLSADVTDPPAEYPAYSTGYYAVFLRDSSGIALEFCHPPNMTL